MGMKIVATTCTRDCPNSCGLLATVEDGRMTGLQGNKDNPVTAGLMCAKTRRFHKRVYSSERILHPLRKIGGRFVQISWEDALDEIAEHIERLRKESRQKCILYYQGFGSRTALRMVNKRFFNIIGATMTKGTVCGGAGQASQDLDFGNRISHDPCDYANSASMVLWGRNPVATNMALLPYINDIRKKNGTIILIDPLETQTSARATFQIRPRPGSDAFLALGVARILHERGCEDTDFLKDHCNGYTAYRELLMRRTVKQYAGCCDVPVEDLYRMADVIESQAPTAFVLGWGLHRWEYAHDTIRSIDALGACAGSIGVAGGGVSQGFEEYQPYDWSVWGNDLNRDSRKFYMQLLGQELEEADPPIEMLMVTGGNPVAMIPNTQQTRRAISKIPFKVVVGHFIDDTAALADIFLPATTFLEERDIVASYGHSFTGSVNPAIDPLGETKSDFDIFMELGSRFEFADEYVKSRQEWLEIILAPTIAQGVSLERLFKGGAYQPEIPHVPYRDKVLPTEDGKFNLLGHLDRSTPLTASSMTSAYPFHLMSTAPQDWLCSELTLEDHIDTLPVYLNLEQAHSRGLRDGDRCRVYNDLGEIDCVVHCVEGYRADVISIPRGGWGMRGCNVNVLTYGIVTKVGGGTAYYETTVEVDRLRG
jgi:anaerobic selenocysteine-containing dehydrogenase